MMPDFEIPDAPAEKPGRLAGAFRLCVAGPDCVRICTRAFDPSYPPSFDPVPDQAPSWVQLWRYDAAMACNASTMPSKVWPCNG